MSLNRRAVLAAAGASALGTKAAVGAATANKQFPKGFLWGVATAGHQVEGNNVNSDVWLLETVKPTIFAEPSGDADNSFELWRTDLDLVRGLGLNTCRFSLEWARIEPEPGRYSVAMLDHYKTIIEGCRARGLKPFVTFNHYTTPRWFAARGGWTVPDSAELFARFCDRAARHLSSGMAYATTLNEPNLVDMLGSLLPDAMRPGIAAMNRAAAKACGSPAFRNVLIPDPADVPNVRTHMIQGHEQGRAAIKAARSNLPVGVSLAIPDDQAVGAGSVRDARREQFYGAWLEAAKADDFIGVQNYTRTLWNDKGQLPPPAGSKLNGGGEEIYPPSLANAVRYAHQKTGVPVIVTEHGLGSDDDAARAELIPAALSELHKAMAEGVPVKGYIHWSLLDNFEWFFGFKRHFGLFSVDRTTFQRTPKPSAALLASIARRNRA
jgi:beta-glucosidase